MMKEIKKSLDRLEYYERLTDEKFEVWEQDPTNTDKEEAYDKSYELEYNEFEHLANLISRFANIDFLVVREMVRLQRVNLLKMFS